MNIKHHTAILSGAIISGIFSLIFISDVLSENMHIVENFNQRLFKNWQTRDVSIKVASKNYSIKNEKGNRFLRAQSHRTSIQLARKVSWNLSTKPLLSWRWRMHTLPKKANEAARGRNDSGAALYIIFQRRKIPFLSWKYQPINVIKYVWSTTLPVGRVVKKEKTKLGKIIYEGRFIVLQSGKKHAGKWITEKRNVLEDYRRVFGSRPKYNPILIGILSDSNDTKSSAMADYDDISIGN